LQWDDLAVKKYYLDYLLFHEIGHHVDYVYHSYWSKANIKQREDFANSYAIEWSNHGKIISE